METREQYLREERVYNQRFRKRDRRGRIIGMLEG